jgi:hypothetical protein
MTKRFERIKRKGIHFTPKDRLIVEAVFEARYLTNLMVQRLFFTPTTYSWCKTRLRYLYDRGYLKKRLAYQTEPDIYYLGLKGKRYIIKQAGLDKDFVDKVAGIPGAGEVTGLQIRHDLTLSRLYVNARLECREHGWEMGWSNARVLELEKLGVQPDARITVSRGEKIKQAFIEFTNEPPKEAEMEGKLRGYEQYFDNVMPTVVLWFTTSQNKANQIIKATQGYPYRSYVLVGLVEDASQFISRPIWRWSEAETKVQWIKPVETILYKATTPQ